MFRRFLTLGAIAALFTVLTVAPALAIAQNTGQGAKTSIAPQGGPHDDGPNNAHGPACGNSDFTGDGCANHTSPDAAVDATSSVPGLNTPGGTNLGAWNAVFQTMGTNSAICGIWATVEEAEDGFEFGLRLRPAAAGVTTRANHTPSKVPALW
jgi:hypothetical protein